MRIPTATKSAQGRARQLTAERLVNLYAEAAPDGSKSAVAVHGCPGLTRFCEISTERPRGLFRRPRPGLLDGGYGFDQTAWDTTITHGFTGACNALAVGDTGRVVGVGGSGGVRYSDDKGQTWSAATSTFGTSAVLGVAWGNGKFMAVGASSKLAISTDGINWTAKTGPAGTISQVVYGNGRWVIVVGSGIHYSTDDGDNWTVTNASAGGTLQKIAYNGSQFICGGQSGNITKSDDGITWASQDLSSIFTAGAILSVTVQGDRWVLGGSSGQLAVSTGGTVWTGVDSGLNDSITASGVGYSTWFVGTNNTQMAYSTDSGATWTEVTPSPISSNYNDIKLAGDTIIAAGAGNMIATLTGYPLPKYSDAELFLVAGLSLYKIFSDASFEYVGKIAGAGPVSMSDNGDQMCITTGAKGYIYESETGLQTITDKAFPGAESVAYLDGFFIFNNPKPGQQREQFFISKLRDGLIYDALDFASAEAYPDDLRRVITDHSELILFGADTTEIWFNAGAADFPFRRAQGSIIEKGLGAKWSVAQCDESVVWIDQHGIVRRLQQGTPVRISTHAIEHKIKLGDWENATAWSYYDEGHNFYVLTVPRRNTSQTAGTYVYDAATGVWHERKSKDRPYSRSAFYAFAYGKHITCDFDRARLYEQSLDVYTEDGEAHIAEMTFPQVQNDGERFIVDQLWIDMEVGDNTSGDPQVMLQESSDGRTWGMLEEWHTMGKQGEYSTRVKWDQRGQHSFYTPKIAISSPVKRAIFAAYAKIRPTR